MKILMVLSSASFSGAENVVCQIIGMFSEYKEYEFIYCSCDGPIRAALKERGVAFAPMSDINTKELKRVINECKPDIVHAHDMRASFVASLVCGKIPLISHIHNNSFDSRGISVKSIAYLYAAKKARRIFWVSQSAFNGYAFHKLFQKKSSVLYNIIDTDALYERMNADRNTYDYDIIYVGRLTYPKNPQRLMFVFQKIVERLPNVKIAVVGSGDLEDETKKLCKELDLQTNVEFLGFQSNPLKMLHDSKVMIMTSRWEGTPMCALEAMALGVPIVSTPTDGLNDLVINGETGYLCEEDELLASACCRIISDSQNHSTLSRNSVERANQMMNVSRYIENVVDAYN